VLFTKVAHVLDCSIDNQRLKISGRWRSSTPLMQLDGTTWPR
jgi:hypothetical protein